MYANKIIMLNELSGIVASLSDGGTSVANPNPLVPVPELPQGLTANEDDLNTEEDRGEREDFYEQNSKAFDDFIALHTLSDDDDLYEFHLTALIVNQEVEAFGGTVAWGDFDASAYAGELFDSANYGDDFVYDSVVSPGSIVGQIADKIGAIVARVRIEENGVLTLFTGANGTEQVASPTAIVSKIHGAVAAVFGGIENRIKEPNLGLEAGPGSAETVNEELKSFNDYANESDGDLSIAAKSYFKTELQGKIIKTVIGDVHIIGGTWQEMKRNIKKDMIKAQLISHIPNILKNGEYLGKESLNKERNDNFIAFHFFEIDDLRIGEYLVNAGVTVAQRQEGQLEFDLSAYGLGHSQEARWKKRKGEVVVSGQKPEITSPIEPEKPVLDSSVGLNTSGVNIVILKVTDLDGNEIIELEDDFSDEEEILPTPEPEIITPEPAKPTPAITGNPETEKQKAKLANLQKLQEMMKSANKVLKNAKTTSAQKTDALIAMGYTDKQAYDLLSPDFAGRIGFSYQLTNNNAVISSTKKRITQLEAQDLAAAKASSGDSETSYDFDGGTIDLDYGDDRLRVNFDSKPDSDMISKLKQNGFKWSPTNTAWQRQLTDNAISTANYLFDTKIQTAASMMNEEENKPRPNPIIENHGDSLKTSFEMELNSLKLETDIQSYDSRLDDIFGRIEAAGLAEDMDVQLNDAADVLTELLAKAEAA